MVKCDTTRNPSPSEWNTFLWGHGPHCSAARSSRRKRGRSPATAGEAGGNGEETPADNGAHYAFYVDDDPLSRLDEERRHLPDLRRPLLLSRAADFPIAEAKPSLKCNGTPHGIAEKLDGLAELGVNCLWFTPAFSQSQLSRLRRDQFLRDQSPPRHKGRFQGPG
ncbi:MAG: hypothetical protein M0C28_19735 [Candidatus Moduliflexus flocculans]|nr:hypothetical protein [Candidatus Moduliflexus flocculans]